MALRKDKIDEKKVIDVHAKLYGEEEIELSSLDDLSIDELNYQFGTYTLLHACIRLGQPALAPYLIERGCDVNIVGDRGTALEDAVAYSNKETVSLLLKNGADINAGRVIVAAIKGESEDKLEIIKMLVDAGVDINERFPMFGDLNHCQTALDFAAGEGKELVEALRGMGAKTNQELQNG